MKLAITHILFFAAIFVSNAQITIEPACLVFVADDVEGIFIIIEVTNFGNEEVDFYWKFEPAADFPANWKFQITDLTLSYDWGDTQSADSVFLVNNIQAGDTGNFI
ncbi:MAG: hypothetical protein ACI86M_003644 [Saprospiraceae bacterium]|jgi:hypothetical protein